MDLELKITKPYHFAKSVGDYGWVVLAPCLWRGENQALERVERLTGGRVVPLELTGHDKDYGVGLKIDVQTTGRLSREEEQEILAKVGWILRLDESLEEFYQLDPDDPVLQRLAKEGRGRLLRSPSLFEDVVKTICTTNTTWTQTKGMVERLVKELGDPLPQNPNRHAFPTPEQVAAQEEKFIKEKIRLGYRSAYVLELAQAIVSGQLDLEGLKDSQPAGGELIIFLKSIKGVGDYAAHTLMMTLGRYGELAIDSEMRRYVSKRHLGGQEAADKDIKKLYGRWGEWQYLYYWFERELCQR